MAEVQVVSHAEKEEEELLLGGMLEALELEVVEELKHNPGLLVLLSLIHVVESSGMVVVVVLDDLGLS